MRKFKCHDCQHKFEVPYGEGGRGADMACPKCGSHNIHRTWDDSLRGIINWGGRGRYAEGSGWGRRSGGQGQGRGRGGCGWWVTSEEPQKEAEEKGGDQT
jgi:DNA-directed RNA polymerase subunit RPC12/RpoP